MIERVTFTGASYLPDGPQIDVPVSTLTSGGWTQCHTELYSNHLDDAQVDAIQEKCNKAKTFMACKEVGSDTLTLAAWANTATVFAVTDDDPDCFDSCQSQVEAGTRWYRNPLDWGFAAADNSLYLDVGEIGDAYEPGTGGTRLSIIVNDYDGGYRCGETTYLYDGDNWERVFFHAN